MGREVESATTRRPSTTRALVWLLLGLLLTFVGLSPRVNATDPVPSPSPLQRQAPLQVELFTREGCPRCAAAREYLDGLHRARPDVQIVIHDIGRDSGARERLRALCAAQRVVVPGVPAFLIGGQLVVGFVDRHHTGSRLEMLLEGRAPGSPQADPGAICSVETEVPCVEPAATSPADEVELPWVGVVRLHELGLPLFTIVIGLIDGFNPCAMWVLLFLLSLLINLKSRGRMLAISGTFVAVSGMVYFAFMAAWLNIFLLLGMARPTQVVLGIVALLMGGIHIKDFFALHRGITLSIPESAKPGLYARMRRVLQARSLSAAVIGATGLALLVNLIELLCTAGLPALYTRVLTLQALPAGQYYAYLLLYNAAYILDDSIMVGIAVVTLSNRRLQERAGRWLKLLSGLVMVGLGLVLILKPTWLLG